MIFQKTLSQAMPPRKPEFPDWYKAFIQMLMSNGFMTGQEMFRGVKSICDSYSHSRNFPKMNTKSKEDVADMIEDMLDELVDGIRYSIVEHFSFQLKVNYSTLS